MNLVIVTGASKGLGLAISSKLIEVGYKVVGISRTLSEEFKSLREQNSDSLFFESYDFNNVNDIQELVRRITKTYGPIYGLVNNAALGHDGVLGTMHESQIEELIKVNVQSPILLTKYACRSMLMKQQGRIINVSSIIASTGFNGLSVYGATKASLNGFTKSLSREVGKANITVNAIAPGFMETAMTSGLQGEKLESIRRRSPMKEMARVEDVAEAVIYLLSDGAKRVTGTTITVDAGSTA
ncbi:3-oxoacyl-ACP reductase [Pseudoalteromonas sp. A25]|nr:3-oxoacyl-ACP reductase [Pseudoalteromonas sp. A25]